MVPMVRAAAALVTRCPHMVLMGGAAAALLIIKLRVGTIKVKRGYFKIEF